jgi:DNA-binding beta-propeller fold protein YncE/plastocyanin
MKAAFALSTALLLAACGGDTAPPDSAPPPDVEPADAAPPDAFVDPVAALAVARFRANCATCHGEDARGGTSWVIDAPAPWIGGHPAADIILAVRAGRPPKMPAFHPDEISDQLLDAIAAYVAVLPDGLVAPPPHDVEVELRDEDPWFFPMQLRIEPGQTVRFHNQGATYHDVSQLEWVASHGAEGASSGQLGPDGAFYLRFTTPGTYTFLCKDHPYMRGEIHVGEDFLPPAHVPGTPVAPPSVAGVGEVWVAAQWQDRIGAPGDGVLHVIDAASWQDVAQIPAGNNPHNLWVLEGGGVVVATSWFDNKVTFVDAATHAVLGEQIVGATAAHVLEPPGAGVIYVSIEGSHYLEALDPTTWNRAPGRLMLSGNMPHGMGYGGGRLLVAHSMTDDASLVDVAAGIEMALIPAGHYPLGAAVSPDGHLGFVGNCLDETVSILDLDAAIKLQDVALTGCVVQIAVTPDGAQAVVAHGSRTAILDTATLAVTADLETGQGAHGVAIVPAAAGGDLAVVTHKFDDHLSVIDVASGVHLGDVPLVLTTTGKSAVAGSTNTGGQGVIWRPTP